MTPEQIASKFADHERWLSEMRELAESIARSNAETVRSNAETAAIAKSNARAIEATANLATETRQDLARLVNIVAEFVQATNTRLAVLEQD
jgi:uncharacterized membrane protein YccC